MMIGGGGNSCNRADHGIGVTEANEAQFGLNVDCGYRDFGDNCNAPTGYSLNLWIKQLSLCLSHKVIFMRYNFASVSKHFNVLIKGCFDPIVYYFIKPNITKKITLKR